MLRLTTLIDIGHGGNTNFAIFVRILLKKTSLVGLNI